MSRSYAEGVHGASASFPRKFSAAGYLGCWGFSEYCWAFWGPRYLTQKTNLHPLRLNLGILPHGRCFQVWLEEDAVDV